MDAERKYIREVVKKSLRANFEKIVVEAKLTEQEEEVVRMVIIRKASTVETSLKLNISESASLTLNSFIFSVTTLTVFNAHSFKSFENSSS